LRRLAKQCWEISKTGTEFEITSGRNVINRGEASIKGYTSCVQLKPYGSRFLNIEVYEPGVSEGKEDC
jgi:hypothetical protein